MYYYRHNGAVLASFEPQTAFGPEISAPTSGQIFFLVHGDPMLGRGHFKVAHPGQLANPHGLENLDASRLTAPEVEDLWAKGYNSALYYTSNERLARIVNYLHVGFAGESFGDIANYLLSGHGVADPYMCLADFESYRQAHADALQVYADKERWNRMSLHNIAAAGHFAADRSIKEYADRIWNLKRLTGVK